MSQNRFLRFDRCRSIVLQAALLFGWGGARTALGDDDFIPPETSEAPAVPAVEEPKADPLRTRPKVSSRTFHRSFASPQSGASPQSVASPQNGTAKSAEAAAPVRSSGQEDAASAEEAIDGDAPGALAAQADEGQEAPAPAPEAPRDGAKDGAKAKEGAKEGASSAGAKDQGGSKAAAPAPPAGARAPAKATDSSPGSKDGKAAKPAASAPVRTPPPAAKAPVGRTGVTPITPPNPPAAAGGQAGQATGNQQPPAGGPAGARPAAGGKQAAPQAPAAGPAVPAAGPAVPAAPGGAAGAGAGAAGAPAAADGGKVTIPPEKGLKGQKVQIFAGVVPLKEFLAFLANYTGLPLIHDSSDQNIMTREITIANDIKEADEDLVKAILEVNKFRVFHETLVPGGMEILRVESMTPTAQGADDPKQTPIIKVKGEQVTTEAGVSLTGLSRTGKERVDSDEFATMVFELKHVPPRDAAEALNTLVRGASGAPGAGGAQGAVVRGSKGFSMVELKNTMFLIITAKFGLLDYIKRLLQIIDVPLIEPERQIRLIPVQEADAEELVSIINEFLQGGQGGRFGGAGRTTRNRRGPTGGQTPTPTPAPGAAGVGGQQQNEYRTNLIPDPRTNMIIVESYNDQDLADIDMLINELDVRFDLRRLKTHIYQVRYLKAVEVAADLQSLLTGTGTGLGGLRRGAGGTAGAGTAGTRAGAATRRTGASRLGAGPGAGGVPGQQGGGANAPLPSLIVPHEPTNSLLIQAEPEEYEEILNVLGKIDTKRRQIFLEAALVGVTSSADLNYTVELLAGNPDDQATRGLFASSFNLTGIDFENFTRIIPDLSDPASVPPGGLAAIMSRGKLPAIVRFFKANRDAQILATPFVLADDNMQNTIEILETRYVVNTATVNTSTTSSQQGEPAGITLAITPTISGSQKAVFLELELTVSEFQQATAAGQPTLPPKTENKLTSSVTIPDGEVFVVGGLTRQGKSKAVSKVPILGDIPLIGKLFRSEATNQNQSNLYIFLQAHILTDEEFRDGAELTEQGQQQMHAFDPAIQPIHFEKPKTARRSPTIDEEKARTSYRNSPPDGDVRSGGRRPRSTSKSTVFSTRHNWEHTDASGAAREDQNAPEAPAGSTAPREGWLLAPSEDEAEPPEPSGGSGSR